MKIYVWFFMIVSILVSFSLGVSFGAKRERENIRADFIKAIRSGGSAVVDEFIITADRQWTEKRPINHIFLLKE